MIKWLVTLMNSSITSDLGIDHCTREQGVFTTFRLQMAMSLFLTKN